MERQLGIVEECDKCIWRDGEDFIVQYGAGKVVVGEVTEREDDNVPEDFVSWSECFAENENRGCVFPLRVEVFDSKTLRLIIQMR